MKNGATLLIVSVLGLVCLGMVMLMSVSAFAPGNGGNPWHYIVRQSIWLAIGLTALVVAATWDYREWTKFSWAILGACTFLLLCCLIPGVGLEINGSKRWLDLGPFNLQPAEFTKLGVVIFLSHWLGKHQKRIEHWDHGFVRPLGILLLPAGLILLQPDLGTTALICILGCSLMFVAGTPLGYIAVLLPFGIVGILTIAVLMPERLGRLTEFLHGGGWQVQQGLIAFGSGGTIGQGLGDSIQKMHYLPEAHTDFIFPIIGEELGLIATLSVVAAFLMIALSGGYISYHAPEPTGVILGTGATLLICLQAGLNMAVVTSMAPAKGVGLPFISYGGSNLVMCLICVGVLINIHRKAHYRSRPEHNVLPQLETVRM